MDLCRFGPVKDFSEYQLGLVSWAGLGWPNLAQDSLGPSAAQPSPVGCVGWAGLGWAALAVLAAPAALAVLAVLAFLAAPGCLAPTGVKGAPSAT